jgi:hypothetical protein
MSHTDALLCCLKTTGGAIVPNTETKREAFQRLAERRTNSALDRIRVIGNLSNPYAYEYTDEDVRAIFVALDQELKTTRAKFTGARRREFKLR